MDFAVALFQQTAWAICLLTNAFERMKYLMLLLFAVFSLACITEQKSTSRIRVLVSARVDTISSEVKAVVKLYESYLNARPDSIYDNPFWNAQEKALYSDFDFSRASMYPEGITAEQLCSNYQPFVLSVEPVGEKLQIRVLFSSPTTDPDYTGSRVWCIQKLNAVKEGQHWVLQNLMADVRKTWNSQQKGLIEYVYPPTHVFNEEKAQRSAAFCSDIIKRFNPSYNTPFTYFVTNTVDDMGQLENFDYYFVGVTTGKAREGMILTAKGNEYYPHEFVHLLLPKNKNRGFVIDEGLAEFLGTKTDVKAYRANLKKLGSDLKADASTINFKSVVSQEVRFNGYQTAYPAGAALCSIVYSRANDKGLLELMTADTSTFEKTVATVLEITGLTVDALEKEWTQLLEITTHEP
jgi:hypothetical protein